MKKKTLPIFLLVSAMLTTTVFAASTVIDIKAKLNKSATINVVGTNVTGGAITYNGKTYLPENALKSLSDDGFSYTNNASTIKLESIEQLKAETVGKNISWMDISSTAFPMFTARHDGIYTTKDFGDNVDISIVNKNKEYDYASGIKYANFSNPNNMIGRTYVGKLASSFVFNLAANSDVSFDIINGWTNTKIKSIKLSAADSGKLFIIPLKGVDVFEINNIKCSTAFTIGNPKIVLQDGKTKDDVRAMVIDGTKFASDQWGTTVVKSAAGLNGVANYGLRQSAKTYCWKQEIPSVVSEACDENAFGSIGLNLGMYGFNTMKCKIASLGNSKYYAVYGQNEKEILDTNTIDGSKSYDISISTKEADTVLPNDIRIMGMDYNSAGYSTQNVDLAVFNIQFSRQ